MKKVSSKMLLVSVLSMGFSIMEGSPELTPNTFQALYKKTWAILSSPKTWKTVAVVGLIYMGRRLLSRKNNDFLAPVPELESKQIPQETAKCATEGHSFYTCLVCLNNFSKLRSAHK